MSDDKNKIKLFEDRKVRHIWDEEAEKWWLSIVDVVFVLTDSADHLTARKYWNKLKQRLTAEGNESVTNCHQLKMKAADGKKYLTDVADTEQILRYPIDFREVKSKFLGNFRGTILQKPAKSYRTIKQPYLRKT